jgi:hypothetical protein
MTGRPHRHSKDAVRFSFPARTGARLPASSRGLERSSLRHEESGESPKHSSSRRPRPFDAMEWCGRRRRLFKVGVMRCGRVPIVARRSTRLTWLSRSIVSTARARARFRASKATSPAATAVMVHPDQRRGVYELPHRPEQCFGGKAPKKTPEKSPRSWHWTSATRKRSTRRWGKKGRAPATTSHCTVSILVLRRRWTRWSARQTAEPRIRGGTSNPTS